MQVKVNVINEMKKLRTSTYSDRYAWVDEVVQNCQRSGASHIDVMIEDDTIVVTDNGCSCTDPQVLFDKSSSGWDETTQKSENPFGEGFFSTMMAADTIQVKSVGFTAIFDVEKMFETNSVDVIEVMPNRKKSGFTLTLTNLRSSVSLWTVMERFRKVGRYIKSPTMTINGERVKYEGLDPKIDSPFIHKFNTPLFKGWIVPDSWADHSRNYGEEIEVKCFAFSRLIKNTTKFMGVRGVVSFNENAITLRSPDRKEFVQDQKYEDCVDAFHEEIQKMYLKMVKIGSDETIAAYADYIQQYVDLNDYKKYVKFQIMENKRPEDTIPDTDIDLSDNVSDDISDNIPEDDMVTDENSWYPSPEDTAQANTDPSNDPFTTDICDSPITNIDQAEVQNNIEFDVVAHPTGCNEVAAQTVQSTKRPKRVSEQTGDFLSGISYGFYLDSNTAITYRDEVQVAQYYNIPIITIRNSLEQTIVMNDDRFQHIGNVQNMITLTAEYHNTNPTTEQEHRAVKLLSRVAKAMNMDENMFIIADTKFKKVLNMPNGDNHAIETIDVIATAYEGNVYINRKYMTAYKDLDDTSSTLTPADIKFLLVNGETFAHEIAHAVYHTADNTLEHAEKTIEILKRIINLIYGRVNLAG